MRPHHLALRGLAHYWRTNLAVVLGVATAVAVLTGALVVGESVRASLRGLVTDRLGRTDHAVVASIFFREALSDDLARAPSVSARFSAVAPLLVAQGFVTAQETGRRVGNVAVYGVDDRFWRFHQMAGVSGPADRDAYLSPALAADLAAGEGATLLVRLQRPSAIPIESLHARKDDLGRTVRVSVNRVLPRLDGGRVLAAAAAGQTCAPCSCRWPACSAISRSRAASTRSSRRWRGTPRESRIVPARCVPCRRLCASARRSKTLAMRVRPLRGPSCRRHRIVRGPAGRSARKPPCARRLPRPRRRRSRCSRTWPTRCGSRAARCPTRS